MEVIGAGYARTGTLSLKAALERLGFAPCYHMLELIGHPEQVSTWQSAADGVAPDWDTLLSRYRAAVDWPACYFWRELSDTYPEAKVILTVRDPDAWFSSHAKLMQMMFELREKAPDEAPDLGIEALVIQILVEGTFAGRLDDRDHCISVYHRHNDEVRAGLPADRLLVFDVREGWGPLCDFLDVEVPDAPFPHLNEGAKVLDNVRAARRGQAPTS